MRLEILALKENTDSTTGLLVGLSRLSGINRVNLFWQWPLTVLAIKEAERRTTQRVNPKSWTEPQSINMKSTCSRAQLFQQISLLFQSNINTKAEATTHFYLLPSSTVKFCFDYTKAFMVPERGQDRITVVFFEDHRPKGVSLTQSLTSYCHLITGA